MAEVNGEVVEGRELLLLSCFFSFLCFSDQPGSELDGDSVLLLSKPIQPYPCRKRSQCVETTNGEPEHHVNPDAEAVVVPVVEQHVPLWHEVREQEVRHWSQGEQRLVEQLEAFQMLVEVELVNLPDQLTYEEVDEHHDADLESTVPDSKDNGRESQSLDQSDQDVGL